MKKNQGMGLKLSSVPLIVFEFEIIKEENIVLINIRTTWPTKIFNVIFVFLRQFASECYFPKQLLVILR